MHQRGASLTTVLIGLFTAMVLFLLAIHAAATIRRNKARHGWEGTLGSLEEVLQRYPKTEANAAALEIERLAGALGIDIVPRHIEDREHPAEDRREEFKRVKTQVFGPYLNAGLEQPLIGAVDAPPEILRTFLAEHDEQLAATRTYLSGATPVWASDTSRLTGAPIPNLLGQLYLQKLMLSAALERVHANDHETALEYLEASWNLAASLHDSPFLINQLIAVAVARMQSGVLRHVQRAPGVWFERLAFDHRGAFLESMKYEGWVWLYTDMTDEEAPLWANLIKPIAGPYNMYCAADVSDAWRVRIENLENVASICDYDLSAEGADLNIPIPRWNQLGGILIPNIADAVRRLSRLELDLEMTRLTLEAANARPAGDEPWPVDLEGERASTSCSSDSFRTSIQDEELHIEFSREIDWSNSRVGPVLPTHAVVGLN